jgi:flagellar L-ring protein precursor FlgH
MKAAYAFAFALFALPIGAAADTLYVAAPPAVGPGHPLRLGPDHRAGQIGDLVHVQYNFAVQSNSTNVSNNSKQFNVGAPGGTGNFSLGFLRIPSSIGGQTGTQSSKTETGATSFTSDLEAIVVMVLPSGALEIAGDQRMNVNGQNQTLHIIGFIRPEDIDTTDTVLASRVANVQASFSGNFQEQNVGLIRKIVNWLF